MINRQEISLDIVIPTYRRGNVLIATIRSLTQQTVMADRILVIDQTSTLDYPSSVSGALEELHQNGTIVWIRQHEPAVSKARNRAILESDSDVLLYLDDDIIPFQDLVEAHLRNYSDPHVHGVIGAVLLCQDETLVPVPPQFEKLTSVEQAFRYSTRFDRRLENVGFMYGGNFSVRKTVAEAIGGWDENVLNYGDRDFGLRTVAAGFRIDYEPGAKIVHLCAPLGGTRVTDPTNRSSSWERCVSLHYIAHRHLTGIDFVRFGLYRAARFSFLLGQNTIRPHRFPVEFWGFCRAFCVARRWARSGVKSCLLNTQKTLRSP